MNRFQRVCEEDDDNHISYNFYRHSFYADKIVHDVATPESGELLNRFQRVCFVFMIVFSLGQSL